VKLVDLQFVEPGVPFPDLHYLLGSSTSKSVRSHARDMLLTNYFQELRKVLALLGHGTLVVTDSDEEYNFDRFWKDYQAGLEYQLVYAMFLLPITMAQKQDVPDYDTGDVSVEEFHEMTKTVLSGCSADKIMVRLTDLVLELADLCVI
jgi:hypothetical protein